MSEHEDRDIILDLFGELDETEHADLEERLATAPELRRRRARFHAVIERYRSEGEEEPPPVRIASSRPGRSTGWLLRIAAMLLVASLAFFAGRATREPGTGEPGGDLDALTMETARLRRQVALLALQQRRATERIAAIEDLAAQAPGDPALAGALWRSLRDDPSVNVRLAALDALFSAPGIAPPSADVERLLASEPETAMRLALVGWLAAAQPAGWEEALREVGESDESTAVRSRVRELLGGVA